MLLEEHSSERVLVKPPVGGIGGPVMYVLLDKFYYILDKKQNSS